MIKSKKILLIGPLTSNDAKSIGGATISFSFLVEYFNKESIDYTLINSQQFPPKIMFSIFKSILFCDIVFLNTSMGGAKYLAPFVSLLSILFRKIFVFRPFGAALHDEYQKFNKIHQKIYSYLILNCDLLLLQTKKLIQDFETRKNIMWFPTTRFKPKSLIQSDFYSKKFIYLGHIREEKGIDLIVKLANKHRYNLTIHLYGPIVQNKYKFLENENWLYKGVINKLDVLQTLNKYDVLILPSHYKGEGYPGSIIEAFSLGKPVISTIWKSIPELVVDGFNGFLIQPKSFEQLEASIQSINESNYITISTNARKSFKNNFDAELLNQKLISKLYSIEK